MELGRARREVQSQNRLLLLAGKAGPRSCRAGAPLPTARALRPGSVAQTEHIPQAGAQAWGQRPSTPLLYPPARKNVWNQQHVPCSKSRFLLWLFLQLTGELLCGAHPPLPPFLQNPAWLGKAWECENYSGFSELSRMVCS